MKAKRNFKIKLLVCCLAVLLLATALAACNKYVPDHYDHLVTFCYNLGKEISGNAPDVYLGLLDPDGNGSLVSIRPGYNTSTFSEASIAGYYLEGWYEPLLDKYDKLQYEADGRVKLQSKSFDFKNTRVYKDITLYANFVKSPRLVFYDIETGEKVGEVDGIRPGEEMTRPTGSLAPKKTVNGEPYTFMGEYYKNTDREPFEFDQPFGDDDTPVYCEFIKGEWTLVRSARDFNAAINNGQNVYLMADIDFSGQIFSSQNYNGELNGNGHTVSGIKLNYTENNRSAINTRNQIQVGVFKTLMARAYVHDVKFEDVTIDVDVTKLSTGNGVEHFDSVSIGLFAAEASEGARVENVTVSGTLTCNAYTKQCVEADVIPLDPFIAGNVNFDRIVNCDYSGVKVIYLS